MKYEKFDYDKIVDAEQSLVSKNHSDRGYEGTMRTLLDVQHILKNKGDALSFGVLDGYKILI